MCGLPADKAAMFEQLCGVPEQIRAAHLLLSQNSNAIMVNRRFHPHRTGVIKKLRGHRKYLKVLLDYYIRLGISQQAAIIKQHSSHDDKARYRNACKFDIPNDAIPLIKGSVLLVEYGKYHRICNPVGVVMDHRFSVIDGFEQLISPLVLSHPTNCEFLQYRDNAIKGRASSIMLDELRTEIKQWDYDHRSRCGSSRMYYGS